MRCHWRWRSGLRQPQEDQRGALSTRPAPRRWKCNRSCFANTRTCTCFAGDLSLNILHATLSLSCGPIRICGSRFLFPSHIVHVPVISQVMRSLHVIATERLCYKARSIRGGGQFGQETDSTAVTSPNGSLARMVRLLGVISRCGQAPCSQSTFPPLETKRPWPGHSRSGSTWQISQQAKRFSRAHSPRNLIVAPSACTLLAVAARWT